MYVIISLLTLVAALTFNICFGARLQSRLQLTGMCLTELVLLVCFLLGACAMILFSRRHPTERGRELDLYEISSLRPASPRHTLGSFLLMAGGFLGSMLYTSLAARLFPAQVQQASDGMLAVLYANSLPMLLIGTAFFPAVCEELLFRGLIQYSFTRHASARYAVVATALLFGSFHLTPVRVPLTMLTGLLLGYALVRSHSIFMPMLMHLFNNALSAILSWYELSIPLRTAIAAPILGLGSLILLGLGAFLLEQDAAASLSRHRVTVLVTAGVIVCLTAALIV